MSKNVVKEAVNADEYKLHANDTGSADYQVAKLTERITELTEHLKIHQKDSSSRRGLLRLVARRRKLLSYLRIENEDRYKKIVAGLGLRG